MDSQEARGFPGFPWRFPISKKATVFLIFVLQEIGVALTTSVFTLQTLFFLLLFVL